MATLLIAPQSFTVTASSQQATAPTLNASRDPAGLVWRSAGLLGVYATLQTTRQPTDTLALVGTNLRAPDAVRVRGAADAAMTTPLFDITVPAWSGVAPARGALTLIQLGQAYSPAFIRLDITSINNPAGFVEVQRIVLGQRVSCDGVDIGVQHSIQGGSTIEDVMGSSSIDPGRARDAWKATVSNIDETTYWSVWYPFLRSVQDSRGFLFVPDDDPALIQNQAMLARVSSAAQATYKSGDLTAIDLNLIQV